MGACRIQMEGWFMLQGCICFAYLEVTAHGQSKYGVVRQPAAHLRIEVEGYVGVCI